MKKTSNSTIPAPDLQVNESATLEEQIAQRAHELWHQRGREHGDDLSDWLRAEREVKAWHQHRMSAAAIPKKKVEQVDSARGGA